MRRQIWLDVFEKSFVIEANWKERILIFGWSAETSAKNVMWVSLTSLKLAWPPIRHVEAFVNMDL